MSGWMWILAGGVVVLAGLRYRRRLRALRPSARVDDDAIRRIIATGRLDDERESRRASLQEAAEAEEEFWAETWDEPEEYRP